MTKRDVVKTVLDGKKPPYVPWSFKFTQEPKELLEKHCGVEDLDPVLEDYPCRKCCHSALEKK